MNMDQLPFLIFGVVFAAVAFNLLYKMLKHGGVKGALFGAGIAETLGEVPGSGPRILNLAVRVHRLSGGARDRAVGLEFVAKSYASYQMFPVALSAADAARLAALLGKAADEASGA